MESIILSHYEESRMDFERIMRIDSIRCRVRVLKDQTPEPFTIMINAFKYNHNAGQWVYYREDIQDLKNVRNILNSLKYNHEDCTFNSYDNNILAEKVLEQCSVCFEMTNVKTDCNHPLCVPCYEKIPEVDTEYGKWTRCPLCREPCAFDYEKYDDF